jgi:hypothetical protein
MDEFEAIKAEMMEVLCHKQWAIDKSDVQEFLEYIRDNFDIKWKPGCPKQ